MTRNELKGKIQTVLGPIAPETLGRTLMHEHVLCDIRPPGRRSENDLGPEITLENVWQMNYGRGLQRAGRKYMLDLEDIATRRKGNGNAVITENRLVRMRREGGEFTAGRIVWMFNIDPNSAAQWLRSLWVRGQLNRPGRGRYVLPEVR